MAICCESASNMLSAFFGLMAMKFTDDETGNSISLTMTEGADDTFDVDVQGHGKGTLKPYEGDTMSVISSMATDDAESEEEAEE